MADPYASYQTFWAAVEQGTVGAFFLQQWNLDPVLWTMQTELYGSFLVFAFLALFGRTRGRLGFLIVAIIIWYDSYYLAFFFGVALSELELVSKGRNAPYPAVLVLLLIGLYFGSYPYYGADTGLWSVLPVIDTSHRQIFYHIMGAFSIIIITVVCDRARHVLSTKVCRFLGRVSYSLYLIHFPLICCIATGMFLLLLPSFGYTPTLLMIFVTIVPTVVATAALFNRFVDEPAIRISDYIAQRLDPDSSATRVKGGDE